MLAWLFLFTIATVNKISASPENKNPNESLFANTINGPVDVTNPLTNMTVTANNAIADGNAKNSITVHLADALGLPVSGQNVTFTINNGSSGITPVVVTDAFGNAVLDLSSTVIGTVTVTAKVNGVSIVFGSPAIVFFVAGPPVATAPTTLLSVVTNNAIANGTATNSVNAHITDADGNPVANQGVLF